MPYRPRSTDVWFNAPGVVAAYQPVAAPNSLLARVNQENGGRLAGKHTATIGVAPNWLSALGFVFTGSEYLVTNVAGNASTPTVLVQFTASNVALAGLVGASTNWGLQHDFYGGRRYINGGSYYLAGGYVLAGNMAFSGATAYLNGIYDAAIPTGSYNNNNLIHIGSDSTGVFLTGTIRAIVFASVVWSASQVAAYSRQMAYCHVNPDWSAWGRRRRYYYAPSAAAGLAFSPVGSGVIGSSVVRRVV